MPRIWRWLLDFWKVFGPLVYRKRSVFRGVKIIFVVFWSMELCAVGGYPLLEANSASVNYGRISTSCTLNMEVLTDSMLSSSRMILCDINFMWYFVWILVSFFLRELESDCVDRWRVLKFLQHAYWVKIKLDPAINLFMLFVYKDTLKHI